MAWGTIQSKFFPPTPSKEVKQGEVAPVEKAVEKKIDIKESKPEAQKELKLPSKTKVFPKKEVSIETQNYWATFTNEDARLKHFKLKKYEDRVEESPIAIKLIQFFQELFTKKTEPKKPVPLDLVNTSEEEGLPLGISLITPLPSPSHGNWEVEKEQLRLVNAGEKGEITFVNNLENGLKVSKRYGFTSENNTIDLEVEIQNNTSQEIPAQLGLQWIGRIELEKLAEEENKDYGLKYAFFKNQKVETKELGGSSSSGCTPSCSAPKKSIEPFEFSDKGDIGWYAFEGEYFAALLIPPPSERNLTVSVKGNEKNILTTNLVSSSITLPPNQTVKIPYRIYLGPKKEDPLAALGVSADKLIDFGFFLDRCQTPPLVLEADQHRHE